jgi:hypothetical protein
MANSVEIDYAENRGTDEIPFGFVYFTNETRAIFAAGIENNRVKEANWGPVSIATLRKAVEFLKKEYPGHDWKV